MSAYDVVVVGGGPAGISTALFLAHQRPELTDRIVVLEKETYPRDKYCAGGIGGRAYNLLAAIGVHIQVPSVVIHGISASFLTGEILLREGDIGYVVRRIEYDHALALAARNRGIRIVEGARVGSVVWSDKGVVVESSKGSFTGSVVVGADGVGSVVRRAMGLPFGKLRAQVVEIDTEPVANDRPRDVFHFEVRDRDYAGYVWDFPTLVDSQQLVCRGAYVVHSNVHKTRDAEVILDARLKQLGLRLNNYRVKRYAERGLDPKLGVSCKRGLLVGEAAGIDPMLGEGIAQAIDYGELAGRYLARKLDRDELRFDDWGQKVQRSLFGMDLWFRTWMMRYFYGEKRDHIERYIVDDPAFLRMGMQYFGGKGVSKLTALRAFARGMVTLGRIKLDIT